MRRVGAISLGCALLMLCPFFSGDALSMSESQKVAHELALDVISKEDLLLYDYGEPQTLRVYWRTGLKLPEAMAAKKFNISEDCWGITLTAQEASFLLKEAHNTEIQVYDRYPEGIAEGKGKKAIRLRLFPEFMDDNTIKLYAGGLVGGIGIRGTILLPKGKFVVIGRDEPGHTCAVILFEFPI